MTLSAVLRDLPPEIRGGVLDLAEDFSKINGYAGTFVRGRRRHPESLDVLVAFDAQGWLLGKRRIGGVTVRMSGHSLRDILFSLFGRVDGTLAQRIADAHILDEQGGPLSEIRGLARAWLESGPTPCSESLRTRIRGKYSNMLEETGRPIGGETESAYLQSWMLHHVVIDLFRLSGWFMPAPCEVLNCLKGKSADAETSVREVLGSKTGADRACALRNLIDSTLKPWGGLADEERVARDGTMEIRVWNPNLNAFEEQTAYDPEECQLPPDAFKIGINDWAARGQDFEELPSEAFERDREYFFWDDSGNPPLPYVNDVVEKAVREYAKRKHVLGVLLFGSRGNGVRPPQPDSDVDLFVVTERRGVIHEKRVVDGVALGFQFVNFTDLYEGTLRQTETGFWRGLKESKILFSRHPSVPLMQGLASATFQAGMRPLSQRELVLRMDRMETMLEDGDWLLKEGDIHSLLLSDNALFCTAVQDWFRMHRMLDTKRTYVMFEIQEKDPELYRLVSDYLTQWDPEAKHNKLREIVLYIEKPFGGPLPDEWGIPAAPSIKS